MVTGLSTGSPAYGDLKPRQQCGIPFLDQAAHLPYKWLYEQQGLGTASNKVVIADGAQIWFLMVISPQSRDTDLFVGEQEQAQIHRRI